MEPLNSIISSLPFKFVVISIRLSACFLKCVLNLWLDTFNAHCHLCCRQPSYFSIDFLHSVFFRKDSVCEFFHVQNCPFFLKKCLSHSSSRILVSIVLMLWMLTVDEIWGQLAPFAASSVLFFCSKVSLFARLVCQSSSALTIVGHFLLEHGVFFKFVFLVFLEWYLQNRSVP